MTPHRTGADRVDAAVLCAIAGDDLALATIQQLPPVTWRDAVARLARRFPADAAEIAALRTDPLQTAPPARPTRRARTGDALDRRRVMAQCAAWACQYSGDGMDSVAVGAMLRCCRDCGVELDPDRAGPASSLAGLERARTLIRAARNMRASA